MIQRRAFPNLRNIIAKTHSADIDRWFPHLRAEAKVSLFKVLIEEKRMGEVLRDLNLNCDLWDYQIYQDSVYNLVITVKIEEA